jgi:hypothetical protein
VRIALVFGLSLLVACGSHVGAVNVNALPAPDRAAIRAVRLYNAAQLPGLKFEVLDVVEGVSCKNKVWDKPASRTLALEQVRHKAWKLGANGITNISYEKAEGTNYSKNCWESVTVSAEAIRVDTLKP